MSDDDQPRDLKRELREAAESLDKASNRLYWLTQQFEGEGDGADWKPGPQLLWMEMVGDELDRLATEYEQKEKRPPAKEVLQVRAEKAAKRRDPDLWAQYHSLLSQINVLQKWVSAKGKTISARQSSLKADRELAGMGG